MSWQRHCDQQHQPCPSPWLCRTDCYFQVAEIETANDKAARHFWEPNQPLHIDAYTGPSRLNRVLDAVGNFADRLGFWLSIALTGAAIGIGYGLGRLFQLFRSTNHREKHERKPN